VHRRDGVGDPPAVGLLGEVGRRAGRDALERHRAVQERRQQDHPGRVPVATHGVEDLKSGEARHLDVEHRHVGRELRDRRQRGQPVANFGDELELRTLTNRAHDRLPKQRVVVGDEDAHAGSSHRKRRYRGTLL
jgi:hypothetical protein